MLYTYAIPWLFLSTFNGETRYAMIHWPIEDPSDQTFRKTVSKKKSMPHYRCTSLGRGGGGRRGQAMITCRRLLIRSTGETRETTSAVTILCPWGAGTWPLLAVKVPTVMAHLYTPHTIGTNMLQCPVTRLNGLMIGGMFARRTPGALLFY